MKILLFIFIGILALFAIFAVITVMAACRLSGKISQEEEQTKFEQHKKELGYEM